MTTRKRTNGECIDCAREGITTKRKAPYPGPRCHSHNREVKASRKAYRHSDHIMAKYGLTTEQYQRIYEYQGGCCAICKRAKGIKKKLSVDHDHETGEIRMLACQGCNRMLGHLRDDPEAFERAAECLRNPPARAALGQITYVPLGGAPVKPSTKNKAGAKPITIGGGDMAIRLL